jgi:hypothetical protein
MSLELKKICFGPNFFVFLPVVPTTTTTQFIVMLPKSHNVSCFCSREVSASIGQSTVKYLISHFILPKSTKSVSSSSQVSMSLTHASIEGPH